MLDCTTEVTEDTEGFAVRFSYISAWKIRASTQNRHSAVELSLLTADDDEGYSHTYESEADQNVHMGLRQSMALFGYGVKGQLSEMICG